MQSATNSSALAGPSTSAADTINPLGLKVIQKEGRGRGVFASKTIPANTVLEDAPVLVLTKEQWDSGRMDDTILGDYGFCWSNGGMALGLGIASLFNHSPHPNVNFIRNTAAGTIRFVTSRAVEVDEELCICYSADETKLWFVPSNPATTVSTAGSTLVSDDEDGSAALAVLEIDDALQHNKTKRTSTETRRQLGGSTHQARERRRAKYRAKLEKQAIEETMEKDEAPIIAPRPVVATGGYPTVGESSRASSVTSMTRREPRPDLPPPLHSQPTGPSRHALNGPAVLTAELDWTDGGSNEIPQSSWGSLIRAKGPIEIEEELEDDDSAKITVWAIDVLDPNLMRHVLAFTKSGIAADPRMRHLKRVRRCVNETGEHVYVALAMVESISAADLQTQLAAFAAPLAALTPHQFDVPRAAARTQEQLKARNVTWPVLYVPAIHRSIDARGTSISRLSWIRSGIHRVLADAARAKVAGELPVAVYCSSPPEPAWPPGDGFIPPTPGLRAAAHDTRISESHPLRHAVLNCIAEIARLRTVPPFSEMQPTRNGADYLLTSMSLFVTHEPCVMCAMALLHSRVREVFFVVPRPRAGGFEGSYGVHSRRDLNHRFDAWRWCGDLVEGLNLEDLTVSPEVEI